MEIYDVNSCSAIEKPYYRPIEAAIRWCNLLKHEEDIIKIATSGGLKLTYGPDIFPDWPCLSINTKKIFDAMVDNELAFGRDGHAVSPGDHVSKSRRTVRHSDLKAWMVKNHPDQKPKFLFDEIERSTHSSINADSFLALQADRDALKIRLENGWEKYHALNKDRDNLRAELASKISEEKTFSDRERGAFLNIIGGLLELIKTPRPNRNTDAAVIRELIENYSDWDGISKANLEKKFSEAKRSRALS